MSKNDKALATADSMDVVAQNEELAALYKESAGMGAENLGGTQPTLKIHTTNKSKNNLLLDGSEPNNGWFYHSSTQEQFEKVQCHVLSISRGYKVLAQDDPKKLKFHQILAGVLTNEDRMLPFIMYLNGLKLSPMWEYGKEIQKFTKVKPTPIPIFALHTVITTKKEKHDHGESWIPQFQYERLENGFPKVVTDPGKFVFLRDNVERMETIMNDIVSRGKSEDSDDWAEEAAAVFDGEQPH